MDIRELLRDAEAFEQNACTCGFEVHFRQAPSVADAAGPKAALLDQLLAESLSVVQPLIHEYIWHQDAFKLTWSHISPPQWHQTKRRITQGGPQNSAMPPTRPYLWGSVEFAENVDDLWLIVHLLKEITAKVRGASARIWDEDGQFLLIEASYHLPKWIRPELMERRVWLHEGKVHLVPPPSHRHPTLPPDPSLDQALQILDAPSVDTLAAPALQDAIARRLALLFPKDAAVPPVHVSRCTLPLAAAHVLRSDPALVSTAVRAFHDRTPEAMTKAARLTNFAPTVMVTVNVPMNRCHFAMLAGEEIGAPKGYPPLPPPSHPTHVAASLGLKIALGLEMACRGHSVADEPPAASSPGPHAPHVDDPVHFAALRPGWPAFKSRLDRSGFFCGELEGSRRYKELVRQAAAAFVASSGGGAATTTAASPVERFRAILRAGLGDAFPLESELPPPSDAGWVAEGRARLEDEIEMREGERAREDARRARKTKGNAFDPANLVGGMEAFLSRMGGIEGAEMPDTGAGVALDPTRFLNVLRETLGVPFGPGTSEGADASGSESEGDSEEEGSSFWDGSDPDSELGQVEDTDEEGDLGPGFMEQYTRALDAQLRGTTLGESFQRVSEPPKTPKPPSVATAAEKKAEGKEEEDNDEEEEEEAGEDMPVNVDANLVESLLQSYTSQVGMSGPAGVLAGMLGVRLPTAQPLQTRGPVEQNEVEGEASAPGPREMGSSKVQASDPVGPAYIDLDALD